MAHHSALRDALVWNTARALAGKVKGGELARRHHVHRKVLAPQHALDVGAAVLREAQANSGLDEIAYHAKAFK